MSRASDRREGRGWPGYLFGGRVRTSTVVLLIAFFATWWIFETYQPAPAPPEQVPANEIVPPGFIPDPAYTWAPRTDVQQRPPAPTTTLPTTPTTTTTPTSPTSVGEVPRRTHSGSRDRDDDHPGRARAGRRRRAATVAIGCPRTCGANGFAAADPRAPDHSAAGYRAHPGHSGNSGNAVMSRSLRLH